MDFTIRAFDVNALNASPRSFSWCPISKTRIALIFTALVGTRNHYFVQIVDFVNLQPVYSKPCYICAAPALAFTVSTMPRITMISDNNLVISVGTEQTSLGMSDTHKFILARFDTEGRIWYVSETAYVTTSAYDPDPVGTQPQFPKMVSHGNGVAFFFGTRITQQSSSVFVVAPAAYTLTLNGDLLTAALLTSLNNAQSNAATPLSMQHVLDLDGMLWVFHGRNANSVFWQIPKNNAATGSNIANFPSLSLQGSLPVNRDLFVKIDAAGSSARLHKIGRNAQDAITGISQTPVIQAPFQDPNNVTTIEDSLWLNNMGQFIQFIGIGGAVMGNPVNMQTPDTEAQVYPNCGLLVGKYDQVGEALLAASAPVTPLNLRMSKRRHDKYLHQIDDRTVAVIGSFAPQDSLVYQNRIFVVRI